MIVCLDTNIDRSTTKIALVYMLKIPICMSTNRQSSYYCSEQKIFNHDWLIDEFAGGMLD